MYHEGEVELNNPRNCPNLKRCKQDSKSLYYTTHFALVATSISTVAIHSKQQPELKQIEAEERRQF